MKLLIALAGLFLFVADSRAKDVCYKNVVDACRVTTGTIPEIIQCNATYSGFRSVEDDLQAYVNTEIAASYYYLLTAAHFGNYQKNRAGFEKLFKSQSDNAWENAIGLIKYITKRGGQADFNKRDGVKTGGTVELGELGSLAKALDIEKHLAEKVHHIHREISRRSDDSHDPEVSSYLEEKFMHKQAKCIRDLSGHVHDLKRLLLDGKDGPLATYMFDEYLQSM